MINSKKLFLEFLSGLLLSAIFFFAFFKFFALAITDEIALVFGGDKTNVFSGIFLGITLGSVLGVYLVDKVFYKNKQKNFINLLFAIVFSLLGEFVGVLFFNVYGAVMFFVIPIITAFSCLVGYNLVNLMKSKYKQGIVIR